MTVHRGCSEISALGRAWTSSKEATLRYCLHRTRVSGRQRVVVTAEAQIEVGDMVCADGSGQNPRDFVFKAVPRILQIEPVDPIPDAKGKMHAVLRAAAIEPVLAAGVDLMASTD